MASNSGAIRAGRAFIEMFLDKTGVERGLKQVQMRLHSFGRSLTLAGGAMFGAGTAILAPLLTAAKSFANVGSSVFDTAQRLGTSTEAVSELGFAAGLAGADMQTLENSMRKMQRGIAEGSDVFAELGIDLEHLRKLRPEDQFAAIADVIASIEDPASKASAAMEVFGRSGAMLLPVLNAGSSGIAKLREEARSLGLSMSTKDAQAADDLGDSMDKLWRTVQAVWFQVGGALAPALTQFLNITTPVIVNVINWTKENKALVAGVAAAAAGLMAAGATVVTLGMACKLSAVAVGGLSAAIGLLTSAPAIFAAVGAAVLYSTGALGQMKNLMLPLAADAQTSFSAMQNAMAGGDFGKAAEVAMAQVKFWFEAGAMEIEKIWNNIMRGLMDAWSVFVGEVAAWTFQMTGDENLAAAARQNAVDEVGARDRQHQERLREMQAELKAAEDAWKATVDAANAVPAGVPAFELQGIDVEEFDMSQLDRASRQTTLRAQAAGTFSGEAGRMFFSGTDIPKQQLDVLTRMDVKLGKIERGSGIVMGT